jgi:hypothetical protein
MRSFCEYEGQWPIFDGFTTHNYAQQQRSLQHRSYTGLRQIYFQVHISIFLISLAIRLDKTPQIRFLS